MLLARILDADNGRKPMVCRVDGQMSAGGSGAHPPKPARGRLNEIWSNDVSELVQLPDPNLSLESRERHAVYCYLVMALVEHSWAGHKRGSDGTYPWCPRQVNSRKPYLGHNIACVAVNSHGRVIDFDFNHNELFNSSIEHAEARLVRRLFSLLQLASSEIPLRPQRLNPEPSTWAQRLLNGLGEVIETISFEAGDRERGKQSHYSRLLTGTTVYTSLESCAQCSGIHGARRCQGSCVPAVGSGPEQHREHPVQRPPEN